MSKEKTYLVTGGAGFIGSNYIKFLFETYPEVKVVNLDKLTYAGNPENLKSVENRSGYYFVKGDICDRVLVADVFRKYSPDYVINFAAESHVDRSIGDPDDFIKTDIYGVYSLLENCRKYGIERFVQISTDEVYGSIDKGSFSETDTFNPSSPYAASKTGGDRLAFSYFVTYDLPVVITRASNNYGPNQYPEKLIPLFITNAMDDKKLPLYGDGKNVRDWLYVEDHCKGVEYVLQNGKNGEAYNIAGNCEKQNIEITKKILELTGQSDKLIEYVKDRAGHDRRYSLDDSKIAKLGWQPEYDFEEAMRKTVQWYQENEEWWRKIKSGEYLEYYKEHYGQDL
ncbi:MAG: dTDP-glucose 4,6-dehydratase [Candidatus Marinimicrobia bacterium]|nr:dTDP-glucose 4,6-dehydratase [Candidatus Neomarinimicrobiota bacterium]